VYVGEDDTWHHRPLYAHVVHLAHQAGLAGASVFRGIEGFGRADRVHTSRLLSLAEDLPVAIVIIDTADRIEEFLPVLDEVVRDGLVVVDDVRVVPRRRDVPRDEKA
jgi:PII-like signaling protein